MIIHLAATVGVDKVCCDPIETVKNNFEPTLLILELAKKFNCRLFFTSTSETYGELVGSSFSENENLVVPGTFCGRSSYVLGKIMSEHYCLNYYRQFGLEVIIARLFNVIGINQAEAFGMVVPSFVQQSLLNEPITVYGDGSQSRCFCDVSDMVKGIELLINNENCWGEVFNIGGTKKITILELAEFIKKTTCSDSEIVFKPFPDQRSEGRDILHRKGNMTKIRNFTNWEPQLTWQEVIENIIKYENDKNKNKKQNNQALVGNFQLTEKKSAV
jgi:UDP-glucose 4-epimerase